MSEARKYRYDHILDEYGVNFINSICGHRILTRDEEIMYAKRVQKGDKEAANKMIMSNMRLLANRAFVYSHKYRQHDMYIPLVAAGFTGLCKAVQRFDPKRGVRFSTYAQWWIDQSIRISDDLKYLIQVPAYVSDLINRFNKAVNTSQKPNGAELSDAELRKKMRRGLRNPQDFDIGLIKKTCRNAKPVSVNGLEEIIVDKAQEDQSIGDRIIDMVVIDKMIKKALDKRSAMIIRLRYGINTENREPMTLSEVGAVINRTRERVRQIEQEALKKLRRYCSRMKIQGPN
jgi:RNA polymerase sigma factor (sigma-70 family)